MNAYEWDYEYEPEEGGYNIIWRGVEILTGLSEELAIKIVRKHNLVIALIEEKE